MQEEYILLIWCLIIKCFNHQLSLKIYLLTITFWLHFLFSSNLYAVWKISKSFRLIIREKIMALSQSNESLKDTLLQHVIVTLKQVITALKLIWLWLLL